jgi:endonuclease YncB( thermonuclease family)
MFRVGTAALLLLLLASAGSPSEAQEPAPEIVPPAARDVTPPGITPGPPSEGPLLREPVPPPPPDPPRWRRFFLPQTTDAATFKVQGRTIRIAGVTVPTRDEVCRGAEGGEWPCGRTALHSLRMFLRGRAIECFYPHADTAVEITAPCRVGETDLGLWLLDQGWAKPGQYATDEYKAASAAAHCKERGLWRGQPAPEGCVGADSKPQ